LPETAHDLTVQTVGATHAEVLAALHAPAFDHPWNAQDFIDLMETGAQAIMAIGADGPLGFILVRAILDEAEILTLAVRPDARRVGAGRLLVDTAAIQLALSGAATLWLEVAEDNVAGRALYQSAGFEETGRRKGYYRRPEGPVDALVLQRRLAPAA